MTRKIVRQIRSVSSVEVLIPGSGLRDTGHTAPNTWLVKMRSIGGESSESAREHIPRSSLWELTGKNGILAW